ncbi:MAG TPA: SulP family inorganic anion transporter [Oligoflexia bacterium]|nr:SulP family inorganic anion transporter [Oligoflexia bacterium]HMP27834.1 SulP family inorganic anion transporter [Oligoflexia bacterium]
MSLGNQKSLNAKHLPRIGEKLQDDILAGIVVFLVALPLCLGIALASGAPLFSGIVAGVVGGVVVGVLSGSHVSVSGPAAGLTVICVQAISEIGTFEGFLLSVILAGFLQVIFGVLRLGAVGEFFPNSVIKGMLSGIGAVIILKQIPIALGRNTNYEGDLGFWQIGDGENSITAIAQALHSYNQTALVISLSCLLLIILWELMAKKSGGLFRLLPGSLIAVCLGISIDQFFNLYLPERGLTTHADFYVNLPIMSSLEELRGGFYRPNFALIADGKILLWGIVLALVASIESLLAIEASDKLDRYKRITSTNKELRAQGIGNMLSGFLGGLPITTVIIRTSANIYAGNRTKLSTIIHGFLLFFCVLLIPKALNLIPLSALSAILMVVGYRLISPSLIKKMYKGGLDQFLPFVATFLAILFTDLLTGVMVGVCVGLFFILKTNHHDAISLVNDGAEFLLRFNKDLSFINKAELKRALRKIPDGASVMIDGSRAMFIDRDIYDVIADFNEQASHRDIKVALQNMRHKSLGFLSPPGL